MFHSLIDYIDQVKQEAKSEVTTEIMDIIAKQHEVSEVSTFTTADGTDINWLNYGKVYSIWTSQEVETEFVIPMSGHQVATSVDVPPLAEYKGDPLIELVYIKEGTIVLPAALAEISKDGVFVYPASGGDMTVVAGWKLIVRSVLVLDYTPEQVAQHNAKVLAEAKDVLGEDAVNKLLSKGNE
ncbi:hypothetical protein [Lactococcus sp. UBA7128]|nr:hypothetical protein [Lactococcus sp. UBA7128]